MEDRAWDEMEFEQKSDAMPENCIEFYLGGVFHQMPKETIGARVLMTSYGVRSPWWLPARIMARLPLWLTWRFLQPVTEYHYLATIRKEDGN